MWLATLNVARQNTPEKLYFCLKFLTAFVSFKNNIQWSYNYSQTPKIRKQIPTLGDKIYIRPNMDLKNPTEKPDK